MKKLLIDENVARSTVELCRGLGFEVKSVKEESWVGKDDEELLDIASAERYVILSFDKDFVWSCLCRGRPCACPEGDDRWITLHGVLKQITGILDGMRIIAGD